MSFNFKMPQGLAQLCYTLSVYTITKFKTMIVMSVNLIFDEVLALSSDAMSVRSRSKMVKIDVL